MKRTLCTVCNYPTDTPRYRVEHRRDFIHKVERIHRAGDFSNPKPEQRFFISRQRNENIVATGYVRSFPFDFIDSRASPFRLPKAIVSV